MYKKMEKRTQREYYNMIAYYERYMNYHTDRYFNMDKAKKRDILLKKVEKHFYQFLNNAEKDDITRLIINNFKENHGYSGTGKLPNEHLLCWEIQVVVSHYNKFISKEHMEKWYSQEYYNQLASIIKSKKL